MSPHVTHAGRQVVLDPSPAILVRLEAGFGDRLARYSHSLEPCVVQALLGLDLPETKACGKAADEQRTLDLIFRMVVENRK